MRKRHELHNLGSILNVTIEHCVDNVVSERISACLCGVCGEKTQWHFAWAHERAPICEGINISACSISACLISLGPIIFCIFDICVFNFSLIVTFLIGTCFEVIGKHRNLVRCRFIGNRRYKTIRRRRIISACGAISACEKWEEWQLAFWTSRWRGSPGCEASLISACEKGGEWQLAFWTSRWRRSPGCEAFPISACEKGGEWYLASVVRTCFISASGLWQWPYRGICVGEASNPGPPHEGGAQIHNRASQSSYSRNCWVQLDEINLEVELRKRIATIQDPPRWFRGSLRRAYMVSLHEWRRTKSERSWKVFILISRMLLRPTREKGAVGKLEFEDRFRRFLNGQWKELLDECVENQRKPFNGKAPTDEELAQKRRREAEQKVKLKELSRARTHLTSLGIAPGTPETLAELRNEEKRPLNCLEAIPTELLNFKPDLKIILEPSVLENVLRGSGRGSAPDLSGTRYEHMRVLLDDEGDWAIAALFLQFYANAEVPEAISACLRLGRMTALKKPSSGVRGIIAGYIIRRISTRAVAKTFAAKIMEATNPYQFALQTRAGTDALAHVLQAITDMDEDAVIVSLDGIGAFDHVRRAGFSGSYMKLKV